MADNAVSILVFGATGDLAKRKLFPAIYAMYQDGLLGKRFAVIGIGRSAQDEKEFAAEVRESINTYARYEVRDEVEWEEFAGHFRYYALDVKDAAGYRGLKSLADQVDQQFGTEGNRLFYLALAPEYFGIAAQNIKQAGLRETAGWKRLMVEKPFGHDFESAKELNRQIHESFSEEETFRIDHYLGKEMVQNIEVVRFANSMFEPLWNNRHIDNIQITVSETVGVEDRAGYYENAGALRDMVQNHLLQMVMMVAMEPPSRFETEAIRDEKVKVLRSIRKYQPDEVEKFVVRGQYTSGQIRGKSVPGYRNEPGVKADSNTETFAAASLFVDNFRWHGVPFYVRTGKRMPVKATEIVIQFKGMPGSVYLNTFGQVGPNLLVIRVSPSEGMYFLLNAKKPGTEDGIVPIAMDFCNNCDSEHAPEAYERLFSDCIEGDSTFFTRSDEVLEAWKFADPIEKAWSELKPVLHPYEAGTWGPAEADQLLARAGHKWWSVLEETTQERVQAALHTVQ